MSNLTPPSVAGPADRPEPVYRPRPRWFKTFVIIGAAVVVLMAALLLAGGGPGDHGPGRHRSGSAGEPAPAPGGTQGHQPPAGGLR